MHFYTGIERQHVARPVESDLPRDRHTKYPLLYIFHSTNWASSCIYAGWYVPDLVSPRTELCDAVHVVQDGFMEIALRKHYSCQNIVKTDGFELKYLFPAQPSPFTRHNEKCNICILNKEIKLFEG